METVRNVNISNYSTSVQKSIIWYLRYIKIFFLYTMNNNYHIGYIKIFYIDTLSACIKNK